MARLPSIDEPADSSAGHCCVPAPTRRGRGGGEPEARGVITLSPAEGRRHPLANPSRRQVLQRLAEHHIFLVIGSFSLLAQHREAPPARGAADQGRRGRGEAGDRGQPLSAEKQWGEIIGERCRRRRPRRRADCIAISCARSANVGTHVDFTCTRPACGSRPDRSRRRSPSRRGSTVAEALP